MRKRLALAAATVLVSGAGAAAWIAVSSSPAPAATTFTVIEHEGHDGVTGNGGESQGDIFWFYNPVYDDTDSIKVGSDQGICIRMNPKKGTWQCSGTTFLEDGQLVVEGRVYDTKDSTLAVTGGTGSYSAASGTMDVHCYTADDGTGRCDFVFTLT
jgi:hypothetical protein